MILPPRLRRASLLGAATLALTLGASAPATAGTLATSYDLDADLTASYAVPLDWDLPAPDLALAPVGGAPSFVQEPSIAAPRKGVADLAAGQGLTVPGHGLESPERYAIAVSFRLDDADPNDVASGDNVPVLSFDAGVSGSGVVVRDGVLGWWNAPGATFTQVGPVADGAWQSVVVSRSLAGSVRIDRQGDSATVAGAAPSTFGAHVRLLGPGAGAARVARVRTWDGALSTEELDAATAAVADTAAPARVEIDDTYTVDYGGERWMAAPEVAGEADDDGTGPLVVDWSVRAGTCAGTVLASGTDVAGGVFPGYDALTATTWFEEYPEVGGLHDGGAYAICATATDRRGNATTGSLPIRIDATAPVPGVDAPGTSGTPVLTGTGGTAARDEAVVWVTLWRGTTAPDPFDETALDRFAGLGIGDVVGGRWSAVLYDFDLDQTLPPLADGDYVAEVAQCDAVGNCGTTTQGFRVARGVGTVLYPPVHGELQRPAGQTGLPPVRPNVLPTVPAAPAFLASAVSVLERGGLKSLLKPWSVSAGTSTPGQVQVVVFAGSAPKKVTAYASAARKKKAKAAKLPANAIASGTATVKRAGAATVKVTPTKRAKRLVRGKRSVRVTVRTTFTPAGGGTPVAEDRRLTLKR